MLNLSSSAASLCVISFFLAFFSVTSRSLSAWVMSSWPSCIPKAWGCQDDISTLLKDDILILLPHPRFRTRRKALSTEPEGVDNTTHDHPHILLVIEHVSHGRRVQRFREWVTPELLTGGGVHCPERAAIVAEEDQA